MISPELHAEIEHRIKIGSHIYLFALRNGMASVTACRDCGEILSCEYCQAPLALWKTANDKRLFICNTCKRHTPAESACTRCGSWNLFPYGIGVESLFEECLKSFPAAPLFRLDRGSVKNDKEARTVAEQFMQTPGSILIGTELAMHYLPEKIPAIAVASFDSLFSIPSFRVSERIVELITSLREKAASSLFIQTMYSDDRLLKITSKPKLVAWYEEELKEREEFNYPPFTTLIKLVGHIHKENLAGEREALARILAPYSPDIYTAPSPENKNFIRLITLLRIPQKNWWPSTLQKDAVFDPEIHEILKKLKETYNISINPEDLL
jgi:primosomal protein N' (replication factor Y)